MQQNKTSIEEYLDEIKPYLKDINNLKISHAQKIQLTIAINFIFSKAAEERVTHLMSANIEIMIENETDKIINDLFESLLSRL